MKQLTRYESALELTGNEKTAKQILQLADEMDLSDNPYSEPIDVRLLAVMRQYNTSAATGGNRRYSRDT